MPLFYLSFLLGTGSVIAYHLCQKNISTAPNPFAILIVAYVVALVGTILLAFFSPLPLRWPADFEKMSYWPALLGLACVGIEVGVLLAYRSGWKVSTLAVSSSAVSSSALAIAGVLYFSESLSATKALGLVFAIVGVVLLQGR